MNKLIAVALMVLFGLSAWFRASSLASLPETDGDEAWHAIQLVHMMSGEAFSVRTEHGLPLSPIHIPDTTRRRRLTSPSQRRSPRTPTQSPSCTRAK